MKLIDFKHWWDFGQEIKLTLLKFKRFSVFNLEIHHSDYFDWKDVNIYTTVSFLGHSNIFYIGANAWNVSVDLMLFKWRYYEAFTDRAK